MHRISKGVAPENGQLEFARNLCRGAGLAMMSEYSLNVEKRMYLCELLFNCVKIGIKNRKRKISFRTNCKNSRGNLDWVKCSARRYSILRNLASIYGNEKSHHFDRLLHMEDIPYKGKIGEINFFWKFVYDLFVTIFFFFISPYVNENITNASSYEMYVFLSKKFLSDSTTIFKNALSFSSFCR